MRLQKNAPPPPPTNPHYWHEYLPYQSDIGKSFFRKSSVVIMCPQINYRTYTSEGIAIPIFFHNNEQKEEPSETCHIFKDFVKPNFVKLKK